MAFSEAHHWKFSLGTPVSFSPSLADRSDKIKLKFVFKVSGRIAAGVPAEISVSGHISVCLLLFIQVMFSAEGGMRLVFSSVWPHWPHITQLCGLYCFEQTPATLVYCESFLSNHSSDNAILTSTGEREVRCSNFEILMTVRSMYQN